MSQPGSGGVNLRTALILMGALVVGILTGVLTYQGIHVMPLSVIAGGAAFAGAAYFLDWLLE